MDIYQQLVTQITTANPAANLSIADVCMLDQDLAFLNEVHRQLVNPSPETNFLETSQQIFRIGSRWLAGPENLNSWLQTFFRLSDS